PPAAGRKRHLREPAAEVAAQVAGDHGRQAEAHRQVRHEQPADRRIRSDEVMSDHSTSSSNMKTRRDAFWWTYAGAACSGSNWLVCLAVATYSAIKWRKPK